MRNYGKDSECMGGLKERIGRKWRAA